MRLKKALFINRAPFDRLELDFDDSNIFLLSGINGQGKTTILSYIVDAFYELAKEGYRNEFENNQGKYYRVSSSLYSLRTQEVSIVYLRFATKDGQENDYIDIRGNCSEEDYRTILGIDNPIPFSNIKGNLEVSNNAKYWRKHTRKDSIEAFSNEVLTYFPAYRYEQPYFLNTPYKTQLTFNKDMSFSGYLDNPIEVTSDFPEIANWMMDVVLDNHLYAGNSTAVWRNVNSIITLILQSKIKKSVRLGIGRRHEGAQRIAVMSLDDNTEVYPSIFLMSSGEMALVAEFVELLKQADKIRKPIQEVSGIVLIDEVDKHLHIRLQKEILPLLFEKFPNIQFIVTSHAPFLALGLAENSQKIKSTIFNMDRNGCKCALQNNDLYQEVYRMMISENDRFADKFEELSSQIASDNKPLVVTEGATDWKHMKAAFNSLLTHPDFAEKYSTLDFDFLEYEPLNGAETGNIQLEMSNSHLTAMCEAFSKLKQSRKIIFIADADDDKTTKKLSAAGTDYKSWGNNVYSLVLPVPVMRQATPKICIEHLYTDDELKTELEIDGIKRRLYMGREFDNHGISLDKSLFCLDRNSCGDGKINIIDGGSDKRVYRISDDAKTNIALPKMEFAQHILSEDPSLRAFDFSNFEPIFEIIQKILVEPLA